MRINEQVRIMILRNLFLQIPMWGLSLTGLFTGRERTRKKKAFLSEKQCFFVKNLKFHHLKSQICSS